MHPSLNPEHGDPRQNLEGQGPAPLDLSHQHEEAAVTLDLALQEELEARPSSHAMAAAELIDHELREDFGPAFPGIYAWAKPGQPNLLVVSIPRCEVHESMDLAQFADLATQDGFRVQVTDQHLDIEIPMAPRTNGGAINELLAHVPQALMSILPHINGNQPGDIALTALHAQEKAARTIARLDAPAYNTPFKVALRNGSPRTARQYAAVSDIEAAARAIRALSPTWSKADHKALAEAHRALGHYHSEMWSKTANTAALQAFGRPFSVLEGDYRISGIGREEFSEHHKDLLRIHAHSGSAHKALAMAHDHVARYYRLLPTASGLLDGGQE